MPNDPEQLLIIRPGALGDTLMLLPLLEALKGVAHVTAAVRRPGLDILRPHAALCIDMEAGGRQALFEEEPERPASLFGPHPDRVLAFLNDPEGRVARNLKRIFPRADSRVFTGRPLRGHTTHAALYLLQCAAQAGLSVDPEAALKRALVTPLLAVEQCGGERRGIVLHPGSGGGGKNLSPGFWHDFIDRAVEAGERYITVLLGPAEEGLFKEFQQRALSGRISVVLSPETAFLVSLLGRAGFYAGHDSGVTHLAAMLGTATAAVFKGTDPRVWRPLGPRVRVIRAGLGEGPELFGKILSFWESCAP